MIAAVLALAVSLAVAVLCVAAPPGGADGSLLATVGALLGSAGLFGLGSARAGWRNAVASPLSVAALVLLLIFLMRPLSLVAEPESASLGLIAVGFGWEDLTRTVGLGTLGFVLFGAALLAGWRPARPVNTDDAGTVPERRLIRAAIAALALGTALWGALFQRNGGFSALEEDPASLHLGQFSGGYGVFGFMLCLACVLVLLRAWLVQPSRPVAWTLAGAAAISLVAALALQTRGPLLATMVAAVALVMARGRLGGRSMVALALTAVLFLAGFAYMRTVREYAESQPLGTAIEQSLRTDPLSLAGGDFTELDSFVALERLVPDGLDWLHGRSLRDVPGAFVPRRLWGDKPLPIDFELSRVTLGPGRRAGTPFTLAGELYWNFGVAGVVLGMSLLGLLAGVGWRALRGSGRTVAALVAATVVGYSYLLLTRPFGPMLLTMTMALVALVGVAAASGYVGARAPGGRLRGVPLRSRS